LIETLPAARTPDQMISETPQTELRVQLRMKDMDRLGHLNHTCYHDFFLEARAALMEPIRTDTERFVVARVEAEFLHEVRLADGYVDVTAIPAELGTKSVKVEQELRLPNGTLAARGRVVLVAWDVTARHSRALSDRERAALSAVATG
jgi:acyl-CoA thioesterase FadM